MILEMITRIALELVGYPILYAIGFIVLKILSLRRAQILPLCALGYVRKIRWYQCFVYRDGGRFWTPEIVMLAGVVPCVLTKIVAR